MDRSRPKCRVRLSTNNRIWVLGCKCNFSRGLKDRGHQCQDNQSQLYIVPSISCLLMGMVHLWYLKVFHLSNHQYSELNNTLCLGEYQMVFRPPPLFRVEGPRI